LMPLSSLRASRSSYTAAWSFGYLSQAIHGHSAQT
jgi:hypothetical protein